jgi:hypothetical protein
MESTGMRSRGWRPAVVEAGPDTPTTATLADAIEEVANELRRIGEWYGIATDHRIGKLRAAAALLRDQARWKAEALAVLAEWEDVFQAAGCPGRLGQSKAEAVKDSITARVEALGFYADPANWQLFELATSAVERDGGARARAVLGEASRDTR